MGGRRPSDPGEHREGRRAAVGVPAGHEAGRRHEHDCGGRRREIACRSFDRCAAAARGVGGVRSVTFRQARDRDVAQRRRGGAVPDRCHGARLPRESSRDDSCLSIHSAVGAGGVHSPVCRRKLDQHHDSGRPGARLLAPHRQRRHRAREHLPASRDGRAAGGRGRKRRRGSVAGRARRDADQLGCLFPGDVSLRRQPVPVLRAGAGGCALAVRLVLRRLLRDPAFLRAFHSCPARRFRGRASRVRRALQRGLRQSVLADAVLVRAQRATIACQATHGRRRDYGAVHREPRALSPPGRRVLSKDRRRTVRHQPQVADRFANRGHDRRRGRRRSAGAQNRPSRRPRAHHVEHWGPAGILVHLHEQRRSAYGHRPGGIERGPSAGQLRGTWTAFVGRSPRSCRD